MTVIQPINGGVTLFRKHEKYIEREPDDMDVTVQLAWQEKN